MDIFITFVSILFAILCQCLVTYILDVSSNKQSDTVPTCKFFLFLVTIDLQ